MRTVRNSSRLWGVYLVPGGVLGLWVVIGLGGVPSQGDVPAWGVVPGSGGVPGPGVVPGPEGCTWSWGVYLPGGGGCTCPVTPPCEQNDRQV